jgi:hypothetical protein
LNARVNVHRLRQRRPELVATIAPSTADVRHRPERLMANDLRMIRSGKHARSAGVVRMGVGIDDRPRRRAKEVAERGPDARAATGSVAESTTMDPSTATKTRADFQAFMDDVVGDVASDQEIHVIADNYATHKKNDDWLKAHPNVTFHFTPTSV